MESGLLKNFRDLFESLAKIKALAESMENNNVNIRRNDSRDKSNPKYISEH